MTDIQQINTIEGFNESKLKEKGSLFIVQAYPIKSEDNVSEILDKIKKEYFDATHHCYAYKIDKDNFKYSDSGEPSGTAGISILNAIDKFNFINILVVVIRYFGGTKLGAGPLGKAYYNSANKCLENSKKIIKHPYRKLSVELDFDSIGNFHHLVNTFNVKISNIKYSEKAAAEIYVQIQKEEFLKEELIKMTKGNAKVAIGEIIFFKLNSV